MEKENKIKKWLNNNFVSLKLKKSKENIMQNIDKNSRVFFTISNKLKDRNFIEKTIGDAKEKFEPDKTKKKKKKIWGTLFLIANIVLIFGVFYSFATNQGGVQPLSTLFANNPKWTYIFIAIGLYFATVLFNSIKFLILIHSRTKKWRPLFSLKLATIGRYYDLITPLGSGGQPFEIYYLKKEGYSGDIATAIPLAKYMVWQLAFILICSYILIFQPAMCNSTLVKVCAWIGVIIILLLFLFVLFMSITKKFGASLVVSVLKLLNKLKLIKNYRKALEKVLRFVKKYQYCMKTFAKSPFTIISTLIATILSLICNASIAYFVYLSFTDVPVVTWFEILSKCFLCDAAVCFFPLPGGSGATEFSFDALLGEIFPVGTLFWGVLIWRTLTYYLYILQGAIVLIWDFFTTKSKQKKEIKNNNNSTQPKIKQETLNIE